MPTRDTYFDSLKAFLMIFVILGHSLDLGGVNDRLANSLQYWIYTFHMPLFVFVTGYFTNCQSKNFKKGILNLLVVYVIFQALHIVEDRRMPEIRDLLCPAFSLWYILSCVWWRLIARLFEKIGIKSKVELLTFSVILSLIVGFIPYSTIFSTQRTFAFLPFFMLGFMMRGFDVKDCVKSINQELCYLCLIIIFILIYWASIDFFPYLTGRYWYSKMPVPVCLSVASRVLWLVGASVMSVLIMRLVPDSKYLANEGRKTLQYYLLHTLMFPVCWAICNKLSIAHNLLSALGISIFCIVAIYWIKDWKIVSLLVKPIK